MCVQTIHVVILVSLIFKYNTSILINIIEVESI